MITAPSKPVFIVGCPRSGTTWLYHLLLASGTFAIYRSESQIYSRFGPAFGNFRSARDRSNFLQQWLHSEYFHRSGLDSDTFRNSVIEKTRSAGDVLRALMEGICAEQFAQRWADCTPDHALYVRQIKRDFPDALFIHLVRDGRDVALSLARQAFVRGFPWHRRAPEIAAAAYWAWIVQKVGRAAEFLGQDLLTIRYEDLVGNLDAALDSVAGFIGKPMDTRRILGNPIGSIKDPNTSFAEHRDRRDQPGGARWRSMYDSQLLATVEYMIGDVLTAHGYPVATSGMSPILKFRLSSIRPAYYLRFRLGELTRNSGRGGITIPQASEKPQAADSEDPTIRPGQNLGRIREFVRP
jgi:LPS sulfotransferase NodH